VRNTGIKVWKGGIGLVTSDNLSELTWFLIIIIISIIEILVLF